jgi:hypothetical protein
MRQRFFILLLIGLACCKAKEDVITPPVELIINVKDTNNNPLTFNVPVYLFDNYQSYINAKTYYTGANALVTDTAVNGQCTFLNLHANKQYYIYAHYKNYSALSGSQGKYYIDYDNSDNSKITSIVLDSSANISPKVTGTIVMKPADGLVSFWTQNVNQNDLPIQVFLDNNLFGIIDTTFSGQPFYTASGVLNGLVKAGTHNYYATSNNCSGCTWETQPIEIKGGENFSIQLPTCNTGTVIFWTDASNSAALPIDIIRSDSNTVIATITSATSSQPQFYATSAKVVDLPNTYYYTAVSRTNKNCVWTGSYTITAGQCTISPTSPTSLSGYIPTCGE